MSERYPEPSPFEQELARIESPVERQAFSYFFSQSHKESTDVLPHYTWDRFTQGIAPFSGMAWDDVNSFLKLAQIVPNYDEETTIHNGLEHVIPAQHGLRGAFVESIHKHRQQQAVRIIATHPSIATPYIIANTLTAAYMHQYGEDIRSQIYIVVGAYPMTLKYQAELGQLGTQEIAPYDIGIMHGNLVLTAPKTASTETDDETVQEWFDAKRAEFKIANREILDTPGNILIVHPSGRRGKQSKSKRPPYRHTEYRPDSSLSYITQVDVPSFVVGVDDNIFNDPGQPASVVNVAGHSDAKYLSSTIDVINALKLSAELASFGDNQYRLEGRGDQAFRLGIKRRLPGLRLEIQE